MSEVIDDYKLPLSYYKEITFVVVKAPERKRRYYTFKIYDCYDGNSLGK